MAPERVVIGDAELWWGDCREVLPRLDLVDIVATDPPYRGLQGGTRLSMPGSVGLRTYKSITVGDPWEASLDWISCAWGLARKAFFCWCSFHGLSELQQAIPGTLTAIVSWYQRNAPPSSANAPHYANEFCLAYRKAAGLNWRALQTHLDIPRLQAGCIPSKERLLNDDSTAAHPTQKPCGVMEALLAIGGQSVLDPFMGTGTTGIAALMAGQSFVGIERDRRYFDLACRRVEEAYRQLALFPPAPPAPPATQLALLAKGR